MMTSTNGTRAPETGRLELTWANKDRRLLAHDDVTYEWVDPNDWRVSEVRLLDQVDTYGEDSGDNLLIRGDAMHALTALASIPEYTEQYAGKVKLAYIDPPFNTGETFQEYDDNLEHSVWLTMLRDRLEQIHRLLADDGSVWVHCDDAEAHRARCVLDEAFGEDNFVATIVWQKLYARKSNAPVSTNHDLIHVYRRSSAFQMHRQYPSQEQLARYKNRDNDPRGPWQSVSFHVRTDNPERRGEYRYEITLPSGRKVPPPKGRHWNGKRERYEQLLSENRLWFGEDGDSLPRYKQFLDDNQIGLVPFTIWPRAEVGDNQESKHEIQALAPDALDVFSTPKPEHLLARIIELATDPEDLVLDCFAGSGTTAAVAHKLRRHWIAVELSGETIDTFIHPRLQGVIDGTDDIGISIEHTETPAGDLPDGVGPDETRRAAKVLQELFDHGAIDALDEAHVKQTARQLRAAGKVTKATNRSYSGGGGFTELKIAPSMFEELDGTVVLSDWASNGKLADHVAAQLGFTRQVDAPFAGRKGRTRLAVIDGMLTGGVADHLIAHLEERETVTVVAVALEPGVEEHLRASRPGSRARKVPRDLARSGKLPSRLVRIGHDKGPGQ